MRMHGHYIELRIEDKRLSSNEEDSKNTKRSGGEYMSYEIETNTDPEELRFRKNFKERHGGLVMEFTAQTFFNFIPKRLYIEKKIYGKGIEQKQHANFYQDIDGKDDYSGCRSSRHY